MLIHQSNSYAHRSQRRTGRREAQSLGTGQQGKNPPFRYTEPSFCNVSDTWFDDMPWFVEQMECNV